MSEDTVVIELMSGVEGPSLYIDGVRVCGNKPWGGGKIKHKWVARRADILASAKKPHKQGAK